MVQLNPDMPSVRNRSARKRPLARDIIPHELLDLTPNIIFVVTQDGLIIEVNRHACNAFGKAEDELLDFPFYSLCCIGEESKIKPLIDECFKTGVTTTAQTQLTAGNGANLVVDLTLTRYPKSKRVRKYYCVLIGRDVSEEKRRDLDLLRFSNIAHYTVNPVEITDPEGKIIYVNPAFEKASGYSQDELLGKNPKVFGSGKHPKAFWDKMWNTIRAGKVWVGEIENRRRTGEPIFTQLLISPIIDVDGTIVGYFGVHRDITELKHMEQQLIHAQKMESIGLLAAGIAHEVGNPLTSISSIVQVIQRTTQDEFTQEKLELIKSQITRISRIIRDLVDFSRRSSYEVQMTDINKGLHEAVEIVRVGRKAKEITFNVLLGDNLPLLPLVPDQVEQVFINIIINAVDAINSAVQEMPARQRKKEITVTSSITDENVEVKIHDTGKGISEDTLPKIFEPFFTTKKVGEGTGLGLWVSYGIIKSFQGTITVESTENEGTTFIITLPLHTDLA
ncbi:MAG: PAS domain-containing sensor histidine kinase [Bacteroidetes bacterium]|nr:MAG: PAS domain-containing sensor histidine kinase [Bacteroidota bacterium]